MRTGLISTAALAALLGSTALARADGEACSPVTTASLGISSIEITGSKTQDAANGLPKHCILTGLANRRTGVDGKQYAIGFELRLPAEWNGRFLHQVNGGNDGVVVPALGSLPEGLASGGTVPLARGFAVLSSDSGHSGSDPANKSLGLTAGAAFGLDPQARRDYGYAADMTLSPVAKQIIALHYGRKPDRSYMAGCSNGGRHTMVAASRMPENYDGFLVGNPGFDLPRAAIQHAWDVQAFLKADPDLRKSITKEDAQLVSSRITEACDTLDGVKDGLTANLAACQKAFDFKSLACAPGQNSACLSEAKVDALKMSLAGPKNSKGEPLYSDWPLDGGIGTGNWRTWKVESPIAPWNNYPIIATMGAASLNYIFSTPPVVVEGSNEKLVEALKAYDFDKDAPRIFAKDATFTESAMDFMTPPDIDDPKLASLQKSGGKMLIYHGQADPVFSVNDTIRWYDRLNKNLQGHADSVARLFTIPGETHCGGGVTLDKFDALTALTDWVEKGKAPERVIASANPANKEVPASWSPGRTRPLCPYPSYAAYSGQGDSEDAANFVCKTP
ncbi:tannase/feruloyl esterase family alpha/beta hydrolase [Bradyrhizobium sp. WYCCWR 13023]|uniref:Tannase/feruloyl esterase family alpha/beta hydrolase n=1 Tax=Bradyrhizobium zhengyangense TaxID=2911009 RepID=A0A9X1RCE6_9BRAD|nr:MULTISPECIES: tannase/feruloyl esterase family alpha/beta hydrolase [Bradyrhizobium]MCG2629030.1 tannase/feruloyl esterase family alpha/beta hydrolase [Bradyrhizobium zhengyangense]MCG2638942.1 tannase/feruloyl esterase family alpha/beta hydrolase [Bradyrhizobium zhengyangense]MCG2670169.1 tannase/feruloyl esterase family alpha/beta hydrolase [Bradyrhizobium zhengyangense]MDA9526152.1 feruloyl esterase [Bradyrhizobium sp. CCBAU 11434]